VCSVCYLHEQKQKKKKTHDFINRKGSFDRESLFFFFLSRTKTGSILRCNSPSDCVEAFDHVCPPVSLGWVVGVWTKMIDQLEGISICSSKLEVSQAFVSNVFHSKSGVVDSKGTHLSFWCMHDKCMNMQSIWWTCPSRGDIWSSLLYDETRILILAQTLQWKFSEWRSFCHPQVLNSRCFKKGSPQCK
jgi:hypothetical protein